MAIRNPRGNTDQYIILTRANTAANNRNPPNTEFSWRRNGLRSHPISTRLTRRPKRPLRQNTNNKINPRLRNRIYDIKNKRKRNWPRLRQTHLNSNAFRHNKRLFGEHGAAQEQRRRNTNRFTPNINILKQKSKKGTRRANARRNRLGPSSVSNISSLHLKASRGVITSPEKSQVRNLKDNMRSNMNRKAKQLSLGLYSQGHALRGKLVRSGQSAKTVKRSGETNKEVQYKHNKISQLDKQRVMYAKEHGKLLAQSAKKNSETKASVRNKNETLNITSSIRGSLIHIQKQINMLMEQLKYTGNNVDSKKQSLTDISNEPAQLNKNIIPDIKAAPVSSSEADALPRKSKAKSEKIITQEPDTLNNVLIQKKAMQNNQMIRKTKTLGKEIEKKRSPTIRVKTTTQDPETALEDPVTTPKPIANKMTDLIFYQPGSKPLKVSVQQGAKITHVREENGTSKLVIESKPLIPTAAKNVTTEEPPEIEAP